MPGAREWIVADEGRDKGRAHGSEAFRHGSPLEGFGKVIFQHEVQHGSFVDLFTSERCPVQRIEEILPALGEAFDPCGIAANKIENLMCGEDGMSP